MKTFAISKVYVIGPILTKSIQRALCLMLKFYYFGGPGKLEN
jgi:hypothetical protein